MESTQRIDAILKACCADYDSKYLRMRPFKIGEYIYATDARIAVRTESPTSLELGEPMDGVLKIEWTSDASEIEWPVLPSLPTITEQDCGECYGNGSRQCDMDHMHPCPECNGTGKESIAKPGMLPLIRIGPCCFDALYCRMVQLIGGKIRPDEAAKPASFRADGIEGLVMPALTSNGEGMRDVSIGVLRRVRDLESAMVAQVSGAV